MCHTRAPFPKTCLCLIQATAADEVRNFGVPARPHNEANGTGRVSAGGNEILASEYRPSWPSLSSYQLEARSFRRASPAVKPSGQGPRVSMDSRACW